MITCRTATERLLARWNAPTPQHTKDLQAELQAAIDHIHHCPRCEGRLGILVRALSANAEDPLTCVECEALLPDYVQAVRAGEAGGARWQPIAAHLGKSNGARAVGNALARNPFPLIVPCHRAIRSDRHLGGFQGGLEMKRALLAKEGIAFDDAGRVFCRHFYYEKQ